MFAVTLKICGHSKLAIARCRAGQILSAIVQAGSGVEALSGEAGSVTKPWAGMLILANVNGISCGFILWSKNAHVSQGRVKESLHGTIKQHGLTRSKGGTGGCKRHLPIFDLCAIDAAVTATE